MRHIYEFGDSPCCMKVRMAMLEKGLSFEKRFVNSWAFDHYQPEYQAINPLSLVPTLVDDDGTQILQSNVIVEYLEQKYPSPVLLPEDPARAAQVREWMVIEQDYLFAAIVVMSFNTMMKTRVEVFGYDQLAQWSTKFPDQDKAQDYLRRVSAPVDHAGVTAARKKVDFHLKRLQKQLQRYDGPWVCGEQFTLADICLAGIFDRLEYLAETALYEQYQEVDQWFQALKNRDSYKEGVHKFEDRMWGPLKSPADYPYKEEEKFSWGYWNNR